ncbi:hypothetical protein SCLCIDRAFT_30471 [Scleroderma citrinum Foug A]|uniref:Uncharacterized protein n=1 Tax=Scleroderma citrinum Foug A TaxID=1036808 RepID=A0A0C3D3F1_9AGAM|nr:hypothetical protein SCLCIDRAFT_30471 [Scleroderma citrinum Foug A]
MNAKKAAEIQAGIQHAAAVEDSLAIRASNQVQQFKKPTTALLRKATWPNEKPLSQDVVNTAQDPGNEDGTMPLQGGVSTPSGSEFEPEEDMESEQNEESLDDRRPACSSEANTKRGLKAALKAMRDRITQARSSSSHIPTTASSGRKRACEGTLDGPDLTLKRPNLGVGTTKPALFNRATSGLRADFQQSKTKASKLTQDFSITPGAGVGFKALPSMGLTYHSTPILPAPSTSGGLPSDEDDHFELSSGTSTMPTNNISTGIKGQLSKRTAGTPTTQVIPNAPQQRLQHSAVIANAVMTSNKARPPPSNNNLPAGACYFYTAYFVPVLRKYVGSFNNPWVTDGLIGPIQTIWNGIMKGWPHTISNETDVIYRLSIQRLYKWRTIISKAALEALEAHWASDAKYNDPEAHKEYVEFVLGPGLPFLYSHVEHQDRDDTIQILSLPSHLADICKPSQLSCFD